MDHDADPTALTRLAVAATLHCLTGCAIGEVLGMVLATALDLSNTVSVLLSVALAFLFGYGMTIAPFFSCNSWLLGEAAPAGTTTEAFAWNSSMIFGGAAIGTALAGTLAQSTGPTAALCVTSAAGLLTFVTSLTGRRRVGVVKPPRARGGCLGVIRNRAWKAAKSPGELPNERRSRNACLDPGN